MKEDLLNLSIWLLTLASLVNGLFSLSPSSITMAVPYPSFINTLHLCVSNMFGAFSSGVVVH